MGGKEEYLGEKKSKTDGKWSVRKGFRRAFKNCKVFRESIGLREKIANLVERLEKRNTSYLGEKKSGADAK